MVAPRPYLGAQGFLQDGTYAQPNARFALPPLFSLPSKHGPQPALSTTAQQSAAPTVALPGFKASSSKLNATAAVLAAVNAKEQALISTLGAKSNLTTASATLAAYKNLTSGSLLTVVQPSASALSSPSGTLQCVVNADGVVAGLVGGNGEKGGGVGGLIFFAAIQNAHAIPPQTTYTQATMFAPLLRTRPWPSPSATVTSAA